MECYSREMALVKVPWTHETQKSITDIARLFRAEVKRTEQSLFIIQVTGRPESKKVDAFIERMKELADEVEVQRTPPVTIRWGKEEAKKFQEVTA